MERHDTWTLKSQKEFCLKGTTLGMDHDFRGARAKSQGQRNQRGKITPTKQRADTRNNPHKHA